MLGQYSQAAASDSPTSRKRARSARTEPPAFPGPPKRTCFLQEGAIARRHILTEAVADSRRGKAPADRVAEVTFAKPGNLLKCAVEVSSGMPKSLAVSECFRTSVKSGRRSLHLALGARNHPAPRRRRFLTAHRQRSVHAAGLCSWVTYVSADNHTPAGPFSPFFRRSPDGGYRTLGRRVLPDVLPRDSDRQRVDSGGAQKQTAMVNTSATIGSTPRRLSDRLDLTPRYREPHSRNRCRSSPRVRITLVRARVRMQSVILGKIARANAAN